MFNDFSVNTIINTYLDSVQHQLYMVLVEESTSIAAGDKRQLKPVVGHQWLCSSSPERAPTHILSLQLLNTHQNILSTSVFGDNFNWNLK